jgi:LysM repeat protein
MKKGMVACLLVALILVFSVPIRASGGGIHTVQPGQTLSSIARQYGVDVGALARANGIVNLNHIYVGQRLTIPKVSAVVPSGGYVVQPGDTLYSIARRYGVTVWAIAQANGIRDLGRIYVGQRLVIPGQTPAPTPAPSQAPVTATSGWRGQYYAGTTPSGGPIFVRNDAAINFRWGTGSPDPRLPHDQFSVAWTRTIAFQGGLYRFSVTADDGARVWINGRLIIDGWKVQPETTYTADVILTPGNHLVAVDYFDELGVAAIKFSFVRLGAAPPIVVTPAPGTPTPAPSTTPAPAPSATPTTPAQGQGWLGQYFDNRALAGSPVGVRLDPAIGFEWGTGSPMSGVPSENFSVRWTRTLSFDAGTYVFCAMVDDGVRIYVRNQLVVDAWHASNSVNYCNTVTLPGGDHPVVVEYYDGGGEALIYVWWERR